MKAPLLFSILLALPAASLLASGDRVDFNYDIRPIISAKCYHCHGPDEGSRKAKLRMDLRDEVIKDRDGIRAIVPGDPEASDALIRILSKDPDEVMPPPKEGHALTAQEAALFRRWIEQGAEYKPHWAFLKPSLASVPAAADLDARVADLTKRDAAQGAKLQPTLPVLKQWAKTPVDWFLLERQLGAGLTPARAADAATLCRRMHLDLTGLPPKPEETEAFVRAYGWNPQAAVSELTDRLLASPAYGERWAKMWLDLARYADSTGYGSDFFRLNIWPYRDWVIQAFNRNLPYDQFTIEQLAGDLLQHPTTEQIVATAFHRNTMTNVEGGTVDEEWRVAAVKDRIATTGQVWMGLTVGCAQCHTHKFDPISIDEYYSFFAVFNQTEDNDRPDEEPTLPLPTQEQLQQQEKLRQVIVELEGKLKGSTPELEAEQRTWETQMTRQVEWQPLPVIEAKAESETKLETQADGSFLASVTDAATDTYTLKVRPVPGLTAVRLEALTDPSLPNQGPGRAGNGNAALTDFKLTITPERPAEGLRVRFVRVEIPGDNKILSLAEVQVFQGGYNIAPKGKAIQSSTYTNAEASRANDGNTEGIYDKGSVAHTNTEKNPWWELDLGEEQNVDALFVWNRTDATVEDRIKGAKVTLFDANRKPLWEKDLRSTPKPSARFMVPGDRDLALQNPSADFAQREWEITKAIDADPKTGWAFVPETGKPHAAVFELAKPADAQPDELLLFKLQQTYGQKHTLGRFRLTGTTAALPVRELPPGIRTALAIAPEQRSPEEKERVTAYFRPLSKQFADVTKQIDAKKAALAKIKPVGVPVLRELAESKRRQTFVMNKGNYLAPGAKVQPALFASFGDTPKDQPIDRLAAARWLVGAENPLTARVAVNRFWAQLFGLGLVESEEDFGTQGSLPSHPELLDWLAVTFRTPKAEGGLGWDVKALLKLLVSSSAYQQSSRVTPELLQKDARNRLVAHYPRRRLDAEAVRDQALALSGLLSGKLGGPSVYPPQPDGLWNVAFNGGQNAYPTSKGEDRYRRGLYTFWRRTMPYPSMSTFDAPSRESCTVRRTPTNTPLQAFVTMNDPAFVECAQALARRVVEEGGADTASRLRYALRLVLGRPAQDAEVAALEALLTDELARYRSEPEAATKLATEPLGPLPAGADAAELAAWTVVANVLLNLDGVLMKS